MTPKNILFHSTDQSLIQSSWLNCRTLLNLSMKMGNLLTAFLQFITSRVIYSENFLRGNDSNIKFDLNPEDSRIFEALCQFLWIQGDPVPLIFDVKNEVYTKQGITLSALRHLEEIGLIVFEVNGFVKKGLGKHTRLFYSGKPTKIGFQNDGNNYLDLGHVLLTERGKKLVSAFHVPRNQQFYEYVIKRWYQQGLVLSSIQIDWDQKTDGLD